MGGQSMLALLRPAGVPFLVGILMSGLVLIFGGALSRAPSLSVLLGATAVAMVAAAGLLVGLGYLLDGKDSHGVYGIRRCLGVLRSWGK